MCVGFPNAFVGWVFSFLVIRTFIKGRERLDSIIQKRQSTAGFYLNYELNNRSYEAFWKIALDTAQYKLTMWLRHEDGIFLKLLYGSEWLQKFFIHINSQRLVNEFIKKFHGNNTVLLLNTLVPKKFVHKDFSEIH
jgi:hypothetical protein